MENLYVSPGICTPEIKFEKTERRLYISGRSFPSDPGEFYKPLIEQIHKYVSENLEDNGFEIIFSLEYYNTSTSKQFAKLLKLFEDSRFNKSIKVRWYHHEHDTDMYEAGYRFSEYTGLSFEILKNTQKQ